MKRSTRDIATDCAGIIITLAAGAALCFLLFRTAMGASIGIELDGIPLCNAASVVYETAIPRRIILQCTPEIFTNGFEGHGHGYPR